MFAEGAIGRGYFSPSCGFPLLEGLSRGIFLGKCGLTSSKCRFKFAPRSAVLCVVYVFSCLLVLYVYWCCCVITGCVHSRRCTKYVVKCMVQREFKKWMRIK